MSVKIIVAKSYPERVDAIAKKLALKGNPSEGLTPSSEWEVGRVRLYLAGEPLKSPGLIRIYRNWEDLQEVIDIRTGKPVHVKFDPTKALPLGDGNVKPGKNEILRALPLNKPMIDWLALGISFSREVVKQLNSINNHLPKQPEGTESQSDSVSKFLSIYLQDEAREQSIKDEIEKLGPSKR